MTSKELFLFASYHKNFPVPKASYVCPIHAGKAISKTSLPFEGDNTGDHISHLNEFYSELTVIYWVWKNFNREYVKYWGIVHYRRFFCNDTFIGRIKKKSIYSYAATQQALDAVLNDTLEQSFLEDFKEYDVILQRPMYVYKKKGIIKSINQHYGDEHFASDWKVTQDILLEKYPEYKKSIHFFDQPKMSFFNMMMAPWHVWDDYLEWLFDILFEVDKQIQKAEDPYQRRVMGYLSERLINLYFFHNSQYKIKYYPIASFEK
ncbi:MAG TPA: DUF4422 domain-containing protein [Flavisolibacter sp.]|nr:DUF4422 domain-containing protein [Flavisolibacter sp.]